MRHRLWVVFLTLAVQVIFGATYLHAFIVQPDFTIASSPNPVGSGARAVGMGGAFIAVADDATAASWNPAGLIQLERPEISIVGDYINRSADYTSPTLPVVNTSSTTRVSNLNYFSATYPFNALNRNMVVSLNYQRLYDFDYNLDYRFEATVPLGGPLFVTTSQDIHYKQDGNLGPLGLAYTVEITPRISFGFTLNIWSDDLGYENSWKETMQAHVETVVTGGPPIPPSITDITIIDEYSDFSGWNANFGVLWDINPYLTIGAVIKTPFTADFNWKHTRPDNSTENFAIDAELDMPLSYGIGLAWRFSDAFTLDLDVYRTHWSDYILKDDKGNKFSPINARRESEADIKDTTQVRFGGEYLFILPDKNLVVPVRAGLFYDPEPFQGDIKDFYGLSLGSGIGYKQFIFDVAYQLRWGNGVDSSNVIAGTEADVDQHLILASMIIHF